MPLIWDTGTSQGLSLFLNDFIHYQNCDIQLKVVLKMRVIGIGTVMYKLCARNGEDVFLPGVAYHQPRFTFSVSSHITNVGVATA